MRFKNDTVKLNGVSQEMKNETLMKLTGQGFKRMISLVFGNDFMSDRFIELINAKLAPDFYQRLNVSKQTGEIILSIDYNNFSYSSKKCVQKLAMSIFVRNTSFKTTVVWKKKSRFGGLIRPYFTEIDEDDVEMWFEDLPIDRIREEYYQNPPTYRIQIDHLSYPVEIDHFTADGLYLLCDLNDDDIGAGEQIIQQIDDFVNNWNIKSEKDGYRNGVIHNSDLKKIEAGFLQYYFDWGSASSEAMNQLLSLLDKTNKIKKLKITSYP